jgi:hypothetical protein
MYKSPNWITKNKRTAEINRGHKQSPETIAKRRLSLLGHRTSQATRRKISLAHKGKTLSEDHRRKLSLAHRGEKSILWKGGLTDINQRLRHSLDYRLWRKAVLERDGNMCVWCKSKSNLEADHIKPFSTHPELRFAIDNGRTLCQQCHRTTDTYPKNFLSQKPADTQNQHFPFLAVDLIKR